MDKAMDAAIGSELRTIRDEQHITQLALAERLHVAQRFISHTESGKRSLRLAEIMGYAVALNMNPLTVYARVKQVLVDKGFI